jgi:2-polyprenyl-6-methoxyphenol hydroxylase-like FAD-dependent oxidoreductase
MSDGHSPAEVIVAGGGMAGLYALRLALAGVAVTVAEEGLLATDRRWLTRDHPPRSILPTQPRIPPVTRLCQ